ncbi:acyl-CoA thioesterase domain-containing protein [Tsukamurella soli]|uniref:Thioesterase family protein n=1 Tax=Tsukamurella soli TaxID=644556 RepID=A0ABP8JN81_9ACTN
MASGTDPVSFFTTDGDLLVPTPFAVSLWSPKQLAGHGVCGLCARDLERHRPEGFIPARTTVDLFMPVLAEPLRLESEVVRKGRRIVVADTRIVQDGITRARASAVFVTTGDDPPGELWSPTEPLPTPPPVADAWQPPSFPTPGGDGTAWTHDFAALGNADRKAIWQFLPPLVAGEPDSPYARTAVVAENTSLITNTGTAGIGFINADLTMALSRLPVGSGLGLRALDHLAVDGVSTGVATLFDREGPVGTATVVALANTRRQIDLTAARRSPRA